MVSLPHLLRRLDERPAAIVLRLVAERHVDRAQRRVAVRRQPRGVARRVVPDDERVGHGEAVLVEPVACAGTRPDEMCEQRVRAIVT